MIRKDDLGGGLIATVGLAAVITANQYDVGSAANVGPGFFPRVVGTGLILAGLLIIFSQRIAARDGSDLKGVFTRMSPRGWICVLGAMILFVPIAGYFGLAPAAFTTVFISALGDRGNTVLHAALLAAVLTVASAIVFWWALGLQLPLLQWSG